MSDTGIHVRYAIYGTVFGFILSRAGFTSWDEIHKMFVFSDLRLFITFMMATGMAMMVFMIVNKRLGHPPVRKVTKDTIIGSLLFGLGWVVTGACPGAALVMPARASSLRSSRSPASCSG
jgi:uncharacterized protein